MSMPLVLSAIGRINILAGKNPVKCYSITDGQLHFSSLSGTALDIYCNVLEPQACILLCSLLFCRKTLLFKGG